MSEPTSASDAVRRPWSGSDRRLPRFLVQPIQSFLNREASGALLLLGATAAALIWANSPWWETYEDFWHSLCERHRAAQRK